MSLKTFSINCDTPRSAIIGFVDILKENPGIDFVIEVAVPENDCEAIFGARALAYGFGRWAIIMDNLVTDHGNEEEIRRDVGNAMLRDRNCDMESWSLERQQEALNEFMAENAAEIDKAVAELEWHVQASLLLEIE